MADFKFDQKGRADLQEHLGQEFKRMEMEANEAAAANSTPEGRAHAFARVLRKYGVENVDTTELKRRFGG